MRYFMLRCNIFRGEISMYLVVIAWLYVALMMSVAEATHSSGTVLGAMITFVLYGALPVALVVYLMGSPSRQRAIKAREAAEFEAWKQAQASGAPDAGREPAADAVASVRKEP
jgi:biotin transporter BioY